MSRLNTGYELGRPTRVCAVSGRALGVGETYVAAMIDQGVGAGNVPRRADYSLEAWNDPKGRPVSDAALVGFWRTTVAEGHHKAKPLLDDDALEDLFAQTDGVTDASDKRAGLRFVLALLLVRRRLWAHESSKGTTMLLRKRGEARPPQGPPLIEVIDPGLDEAMIADVVAELEGGGASGDAQPTPVVPDRSGAEQAS